MFVVDLVAGQLSPLILDAGVWKCLYTVDGIMFFDVDEKER